MATETEHIKMVKTDAKANSNKFWEGVLYDDNSVTTKWGRVGAANPQSKDFPSGGKTFLDKKAKEKEKKGYRQVKTADGTMGSAPAGRSSGTKIANVQLKDIAKKELGRGNKTIEKLVEKLAEVNRHQIAAASGGKITVSTNGLVTTVLGDVVDLDTITEARDHLSGLAGCFDKKKINHDAQYWLDPFNGYLKCIPQDIGHTQTKDWHKTTFTDLAAIQQQNSFLDQLEASIKNAMTSTQKKDATGTQPRVFNTELEIVKDGKILSHIDKLFNKTAQRMHASYSYKVSKVFSVKIDHMYNSFQNHGAKLSNIWELWHGSSAANIMSMLKSGYVIPPSNASHVTGRMFGNGAYFSDQSTKALNYAAGYWSGRSSNEDCYMFLNDIAMGNYNTPSGPRSSPPPSGYDSYFAEGRKSKVMNNEMIIQKTSQANIKYLVEFSK